MIQLNKIIIAIIAGEIELSLYADSSGRDFSLLDFSDDSDFSFLLPSSFEVSLYKITER